MNKVKREFDDLRVKREPSDSPPNESSSHQDGPSSTLTQAASLLTGHPEQGHQVKEENSHTSSSNFFPIQLPPKSTTHPMEILAGLKLIHEAGIKLEAKRQTIVTAFTIYHKFFSSIQQDAPLLQTMIKVQDLIAATSYYISGKIEEDTNFKLRDIINVFYHIHNPNSEPLDPNEVKYTAFRESITQLELVVQRYICFKGRTDHPHPYLANYLRCIMSFSPSDEVKKGVFKKTAWIFLNDFYFSPSFLKYDPKYIALAVIEFTRKFCALSLGEEVSLEEVFFGSTVNSALISQIKDEIQFNCLWLMESGFSMKSGGSACESNLPCTVTATASATQDDFDTQKESV